MKGQDALKLDAASYVFGKVSYIIKRLMYDKIAVVNEFKSAAYVVIRLWCI